jgi:predicted DNA-binding transcriptional regulator AlpA
MTQVQENYQVGSDALWRAKECAARAGMGQSTWWALVAQGIAPKPIKIGCRFTAWRASDVLAFIEQAATGAFKQGVR